jgi:hypothetical protein
MFYLKWYISELMLMSNTFETLMSVRLVEKGMTQLSLINN